jgi:hypothetical protein
MESSGRAARLDGEDRDAPPLRIELVVHEPADVDLVHRYGICVRDVRAATDPRVTSVGFISNCTVV